ncbi:replication protein A 32 kDa subunit-A-like [Andrena cerasifolii]|uniref:replication protein A 32 kDa subunit-A-like n=1 Tax=Andrena cerasifolii TaxID=2819439 RepID=UPI0040383765
MWDNLNSSAENTTGGFLNDSHGATSGQRGNVKRGENIIPVMIRHLTRSCADLKIWGMSVRIITFVGIVRQIQRSTTKLTYGIEDETGCITAFHWLEADNEIAKCTLNLNSYVRIYGHPREENNKTHVLILKILPLLSLNELTNHLLEVIHVMLKMQKISNMENEGSNAAQMNNVCMSDSNLSGLTTEQTTVFKIIQTENDTENGIARDTLKMRVPRNIVSILDNIIEFLTSEGHIYTTLTDDHFKTT